MERIATIRGQWFRLRRTGSVDASIVRFEVYEMATDKLLKDFASLTEAAMFVLRLVGRSGRISGRRFWGIGTDECGCGLSYGSMWTDLKWSDGMDVCWGAKIAQASGQVRWPNKRDKNVRMALQKLKRARWEEHRALCELSRRKEDAAK